MFAQSLSREVGVRGITVNSVQPGPNRYGFESGTRRLGHAAEGDS